MRASHEAVGVGGGLVIGLLVFLNQIAAQTVLESPAFSDPNLLAAIFVPAKSIPSFDEVVTPPSSEFPSLHREFRLKPRRLPIPDDWEEFDKRFSPEQHSGKPTLQLLENGMYQVNQIIYSVKLFEP